jgi:hypothetical protein
LICYSEPDLEEEEEQEVDSENNEEEEDEESGTDSDLLPEVPAKTIEDYLNEGRSSKSIVASEEDAESEEVTVVSSRVVTPKKITAKRKLLSGSKSSGRSVKRYTTS